MKTFHNILAALGLAALLTSCIDLTTETKSSFDESVVFSNYTLAENSIMGAYAAFGMTNSHRSRFLPWYGFNTDIEAYTTTTYSNGKLELAAYDCAVNNAVMNVNENPFASMYIGIERINLVIKGLRQYGNVSSDKEMRFLLGEALTLRAVFYADLMKAFGEVPARFEPVSPETIYLNKSDRDVIYKQLLGDLEEAIPYLPWPTGNAATASTGRMSRAFAEGLYARLALAASGYAMRPAEGKVGTGDPGSIRLSSDPDLQSGVLYEKALGYLEDCIQHSGNHLLDYEQLWHDFNNMDMTAGKEVLFAYPFSNGRGRWNYHFAVANTTGTAWVGSSARGGDAGPLAYLYYKYGENDVRRDLTCIPWHWEKGTDGIDREVPNGGAKWYFGKYRFEWMGNPYTGGNDDGIKPILMRYADVLLMAAEIANELGRLDDAKDYLLQVRSRAYKGHETEAQAYVNALSRETFFDAIVEERALEFCGEFLRKADLIRWNLLKTKLDEAKNELLDMRDRTGAYTNLPDYVYYKYEADGQTIKMYGLHPGETDYESLGEGWEPYLNSEGQPTKYFSTSETGGLTDKANTLYREGIDPEQHMYWPIFQIDLTNSVNTIVNDYGY